MNTSMKVPGGHQISVNDPGIGVSYIHSENPPTKVVSCNRKITEEGTTESQEPPTKTNRSKSQGNSYNVTKQSKALQKYQLELTKKSHKMQKSHNFKI
jgi:hypothetical protein